MRPASVAADTGVRSSDRRRLRTGSSATLADAGSSMTRKSTIARSVSLTKILVKAFRQIFFSALSQLNSAQFDSALAAPFKGLLACGRTRITLVAEFARWTYW